MARYSVVIKRSAQKEIRDLPTRKLRRAVVVRIEGLADDPRPPGCARITGTDKYRIRQGPYRILYTVHDTRVVVVIVRVAHRQSVYRP